MMRNLFRLLAAGLLLLVMGDCLALTQDEKLWLAVNAQQTFSPDKKWLSFVYSQFRFINKNHPWESTLLESGIGYQLFTNANVWAGYRWTGRNPNNGFFQENRFFQQIIWDANPSKLHRIIYRARLEETERTNETEMSYRIRGRMRLEFETDLPKKILPYVYDEVFVPLNKTNYTSHTLISENRLSVGVNLYRDQGAWWEIGYINQYQLHTPQNIENEMSHIASITYNFV